MINEVFGNLGEAYAEISNCKVLIVLLVLRVSL